MSGVWVWIDQDSGNIAPISLEALGAGHRVADELGASLTAVVLGEGVQGLAEQAFTYGANAVLGMDGAVFSPFRAEAYGRALAQLVAEREPAVLLLGNSSRGHDLAAWVAALLDLGLAADGTDLTVQDGRLVVTRPVYAGKLLCDVQVTGGVQIVTLRSRAFAPAGANGGGGEVEWVQPAVSEEQIGSKVQGFESAGSIVSLSDARIIVSGGRGVGGPEGFSPIRELANVLNAAVGASRATVDAGWIPYEHQVGQTGKTVSPDLYIATGISGAIQHQAGMRTSKVIVAINSDPEAPIFKLANYGVVGDLFQIVPALTEEFRKRLG
jgi:electron transfer flavoprotein alpha subunit